MTRRKATTISRLSAVILVLAGMVLNSCKPAFRETSLPMEERISDLLERLTLDEKINLLVATSEAIPRLGIDKYHHGNEALHGIVRPGNFTVFPQAIGLAATWNPELIHRVSAVISDEARARWNFYNQGEEQLAHYSDLLTFWSPTVNMARDPRWGRTPETYGEDPYLASRLGVAFVKGLQGDHPRYLKAVSTPKHFAANNEEHNRFECNASISEEALREYYLPAFRALVTEGGAEAVMSAYNAINGVPCTANSWLLNDLLRDEWGFDGYVVSDCGAVGFLHSHHHHTEDTTGAAVEALKAGVDLECIGETYRRNLRAAYEQGRLTMADIDTAAYRVLRARFKLGIFDPPGDNPYTTLSPEIIGSEKHQQLALETALESMVLLKNRGGLLPLDLSQYKKIAVLGPNADRAEFGDYSGTPVIEAVTPLAGITKRAEGYAGIITVPWSHSTEKFNLVETRFLTTEEGEAGLSASYFTNIELSGEARERVDAVVNFDPINQPPDPVVPSSPMSIRWSGYLTPPVTGGYELALKTDDGVRLWINDELVIDSWIIRPEATDLYTTHLKAGERVKVRIEYFDNGGAAICQLIWNTPKEGNSGIFAADLDAARESDLVIAVLGINKSIEREGIDRTSIDLPQKQREYIKQLNSINPNIVVVLVAGSAQSINWIDAHIPAVLNAWYPGESGGTAIAQVLFGDYNPGGRLPFTYYRSVNDLPPFDDYEVSKGRTYSYFEGDPLYPFGYGLSYTTFEYSNLGTVKTGNNPDDQIEVTLDVSNAGAYDGDEVVQLYAKSLSSSAKGPLRELKGFKRIHLAKGETKKVHFTLPVGELRQWDSDAHAWRVEPGRYELMVGSSSQAIKLSKEIQVK
ncbi:MAG: glycoside hydrolase family 3 C-terminal domain-containing protein [Bacteroidota bacterium]